MHQVLQESRGKTPLFKYGAISSKIKMILDSAAPHRRSSSSSGLLKRQYCFTLPYAEQVRGPLSRYHVRITVRGTSPASRLHARVRTRTNNTTFTLYVGNVTRLFLCTYTQSECSLLSRCTHEEHHKTISVLTHAKSAPRPFSRYHAKSIIRQNPRPQAP